MSLSLRASQGVESTREKEFTSWLRVCSLFRVGIRIGILSYPFIPKICSDFILISRLGIKIRSYANFRLEFYV